MWRLRLLWVCALGCVCWVVGYLLICVVCALVVACFVVRVACLRAGMMFPGVYCGFFGGVLVLDLFGFGLLRGVGFILGCFGLLLVWGV